MSGKGKRNKSKGILNLRIIKDEFVDGPIQNVTLVTASGSNVDLGGLRPPKITSIDQKTGIVYFDNPSGYQVEIYKFTKKTKGLHSNKPPKGPYSNRIGKRYKPLRLLPYNATSWTVELRWIRGASASINRYNKRNYFKLGVRNPDTGERSDLSVLTIITAVKWEWNVGNRIFINGVGGGENLGCNPCAP